MEVALMKTTGMISTAALSLLLGIAAPIYAQQDQHEQEQKDKPAQQEEKKAPEAKSAKPEEKAPQQKQENAKQEKAPQQQDKGAKQEQKAPQQQDKGAKQEQKASQQQDKNTKQEEKNARQQPQHTQPAKLVQETQSASGNNGHGGSIPQDRYQAHFGRQHTFRVSQADYARDRRFQYGGRWFGVVGPWAR